MTGYGTERQMKIFIENDLIVIQKIMSVREQTFCSIAYLQCPNHFTFEVQLVNSFSKCGTAGGTHDCALAMRGKISSPQCPHYLSDVTTTIGNESLGSHTCRLDNDNAVLE
jgi:hypothetical protein